MTYKEALARALEAGATLERVEEYAARTRKDIPTRNMVRALQMHSWHNTADEWARLAGTIKGLRAR